MEEKRSLHAAALRATVAAVLLSAAGFAAAAEPGFYLGAVAGQSKTEIDQSDSDDLIESEFGPVQRSSVKETDTGFGGFVGYQFLPWLAAEVAYQDLGAASYNADTSLFIPSFVRVPLNVEVKSEVTAASASALLMAPLGDQFSVGVRLGVATTKTKFSISARTAQTPTSLSDSTTNTNGVFGVNAQWNPTPRMGVRLEYQRYKEVGGDSDDDIDGFDVTLLSLGVIWKL